MKTTYIHEAGPRPTHAPDDFVLDLQANTIKDCAGCWCCWQKTPGRCAFKDLDEFYKAFLRADKAVFHIGVQNDFVSVTLKSLFDRMIPLYQPYTSFKTGESMHTPRYEHYPDVEVYYHGSFSSNEAQQLFEEYLARVFYQFHIKNARIRPADAFLEKEIAV